MLYNQPAPTLRSMRPDGTDQMDVPNSPAGIPTTPTADAENGIVYYYYAGQIWRLGLDGSGPTPLATSAQDHVDYGLDTEAAPADTTPPALTLPHDITAEATSPAGASVTYTASANDDVDGSVPVTCTPSSSSMFALGTTTVQCSASDAHGNTASGSFHVNVVDTTPPVVASVTASPAFLWPPNGKLVNVTLQVTATDLADTAPVSRIVSVTSNQAVGSEPDWIVTGPLTLQLRAKRNGSGERRYTIAVETRDGSGNTSTTSVVVLVPHDQR